MHPRQDWDLVGGSGFPHRWAVGWDLLFGEWNGLKQAGQRRSPVIVVGPRMRRSEVRLGLEGEVCGVLSRMAACCHDGHRPGESLAESQVAPTLL